MWFPNDIYCIKSCQTHQTKPCCLDTQEQGQANFFQKGPDSERLCLCGPHCHSHSILGSSVQQLDNVRTSECNCVLIKPQTGRGLFVNPALNLGWPDLSSSALSWLRHRDPPIRHLAHHMTWGRQGSSLEMPWLWESDKARFEPQCSTVSYTTLICTCHVHDCYRSQHTASSAFKR